jgi:1-acyl-sn-glycerol-3-phosphate acyltransferase
VAPAGAMGESMSEVSEIRERLKRLQVELNEFGYDPFGFKPEEMLWAGSIAYLLYRHYFRVAVEGAENIPSEGRAMIVANHGGVIPLDAMMLEMAVFLETEPPRMPRAMVDRFVFDMPYLSTLFARWGQVVGLPDNCLRLLKSEQLVLVFPEGADAMVKPWDRRYQLKPFGTGFLRLAMEADAPIVPAAIVGPEEQYFTLFNSKLLARLLRLPVFPVTFTFPLVGPLGLIPLPVRYRIRFGEPFRPWESGKASEEREILAAVQEVRDRVSGMIQEILQSRESIFL